MASHHNVFPSNLVSGVFIRVPSAFDPNLAQSPILFIKFSDGHWDSLQVMLRGGLAELMVTPETSVSQPLPIPVEK